MRAFVLPALAPLLAMAVVGGCDLGEPPDDQAAGGDAPVASPIELGDQMILAEFVGGIDPVARTMLIEVLPPDEWSDSDHPDSGDLRGLRQALYCEGRVSAGAPDTFSMYTFPDSMFYTIEECGIAGDSPISDALGAFCATVGITSHYSVIVEDVTAVLTVIDPPEAGLYAYPLGTASDPNALPAGPNRPSGIYPIFTHGSPARGERVDHQWTFPGLTGQINFRGILVGRFPELANGLDDNCDGRIDDRLRLYADGTACWVDEDCFSGLCTDIVESTGVGVCANTCLEGEYGPDCLPCPGGSGLAQCDGHGTCDDGASGSGQCVCDPASGHAIGPGGSCDVCAPGYFETGGGGCVECPDCQNGGVCIEVGPEAGTCSCPVPAHDPLCSATCGDGVQNGDEEGIDCGGATCNPCGGCTSCHGSGLNAAPPVAVDGATVVSDIGVGAHQSHMVDGPLSSAFDCGVCHIVPETIADPTHLDGLPGAEVVFAGLAGNGGMASPTWVQGTRRCDDVYCHGSTLPGGFNNIPEWTAPTGTQAICGSCHALPPEAPHPAVNECFLCHSDTISPTFDINLDTHVNGVLEVSLDGACDACHGAPPPTGTHLLHFGAGADAAVYGDTRTATELRPEGDAYVFGCGNCHPMDPARHANGVRNATGGHAEVDLSPAGAPAGSVRALNSPGATYTPGATPFVDAQGYTYTQGTCSEVYCHSESVVLGAPDGVPLPGVDFPFTGYPIVYPPFVVDVERQYSTPTWGVDSLGCDGCHGYSPRTFFSQGVVAGEGDSHSWIDAYGYENLHGWVMAQSPLECMTCHSATVVDPGTVSRTSEGEADRWGVWSPVPIFDFTNHANGQPDILFRADPRVVVVDGWFGPTTYTYDLSTAQYEPSTRTCTNVVCHKLQTSVYWGQPYRWENTPECNSCHQY